MDPLDIEIGPAAGGTVEDLLALTAPSGRTDFTQRNLDPWLS